MLAVTFLALVVAGCGGVPARFKMLFLRLCSAISCVTLVSSVVPVIVYRARTKCHSFAFDLYLYEHREKGGTMSRANEMLRADSRMMVVFGAFTSKSEPLTFEESLRFVKKVKARNYMLYLSLFDILGRMELSQLEAYQELQLLFQNHSDLCEELEKFRPPVPTKHAVHNIWPWVFVCAVPLVAVSLIPALGNPVLWFVQQTLGEKMAA